MGRTVNVVLPGGRVVAVDEADARESGLPVEGEEAGVARAYGEARREAHSGPLETAAAATLGAADTITGGLAGKAVGYFGGDDSASWYQENAQEHPVARGLGELAGVFAPGGLPAGATYAREALGGKALGRVAEGGIYGLGGAVASTNVTGDPLSIEGAIEDIGVGAILNYGFGLAGDTLTGVGKRAQAKLAGEADLKKKLSFIAEGEGVFAKDSSAFDEFRTAYDDARKSAAQSNAAMKREQKAWDEAVSASGVDKGIDVVKKAQQELRAQIAETAYGKTVGKAERAYRGELKAYEAETEAFNGWANSTEDVPRTLKKFDNAIKQLEGRGGKGAKEAAEAAESDELLSQLQGTKERLDEGENLADIADDAPETRAEKVKRYKEQLSIASKKLSGEVEVAPGRWERDPTVPRDPAGALRDLHALRDEMRKNTRLELPDLPAVPRAHPGDFKAPVGDINDVIETGQLAQMSRELESVAKKAKELAAGGDYKGAVAAIEAAAVRAKEAGFGDLVFPKFPKPVRDPVSVPKSKAPSNLREFASKKDVSELAQAVQSMPKEVGEAWGKVMDDLTLKPVGTHADNIGATWKQLNAYTRAAEEMKARALKEAAKRGDWGLIGEVGDAAKRGARIGFGRLFDTGGVGGSMKRAVAGALLGYAVDGVEGATIGASVLSGRTGVRQRITQIAAKAGPRAGSMLRALGPVTAVLHASFPSGEPDKEKDSRKAAINRIREIGLSSISAPDAAYMAVQPLMGHPADIAWKVHQQIVGAVRYLAAMAPKDPGLDLRLQGSNWEPTHAQTLEFAHRIEAVVDPLAAIARTIAGDGHPAAAETLWHVWPAIMQEHAQEFLAMDRNKLTYEQESVAARLLGVETGLREPAVLATLQGLYLPRPTQPTEGTGGSPGRPPAVRSQVAGSNVSSLIS